jgi:hypothetical protein
LNLKKMVRLHYLFCNAEKKKKANATLIYLYKFQLYILVGIHIAFTLNR